MERTILVQDNETAVILEQAQGHFEVTAYINDIPNVAYDTESFADAERWAKAVIGYTA